MSKISEKNTSWGHNAEWYDELIADKDSYQQKVILPNLLRLMEIKRGEKILDIGCGVGLFSNEFHKAGAEVVGVDLGDELITIAREKFSVRGGETPLSVSPLRGERRPASGGNGVQSKIKFEVGSADKLDFLKSGSFDKAVMVLSLQNIENAAGALKEAGRVLKKDGKLFLVLNHPAFRIPGESSWEWVEKEKKQVRRLDRYLSEMKTKIQMHPGGNPEDITWSFHRPLQFYFKSLQKAGFLTERLEEWISHRKTETGPRKEAEDRARSEFPLFLAIVAVKR